MKARRWILVVDTHTAGEPTRVVLGGFPLPHGATMEERQKWVANYADDLRQFILHEPRGHQDMFGALVTPPANPHAHWGIIFFDGAGYLGMCVHGVIGVTTALASLGWIGDEELSFDTPSGLIRCRIEWKNGEPYVVSVQNVPSFYLGHVEVRGVPVDIAYGGNLFALVNASHLGLKVEPAALPKFIQMGLELRDHLNRDHIFCYPGTNKPIRVQLVEFYDDSISPRNVVVFGKGQVDRSPCGTGTCAKMALLHAQGKLGVGQPYRYRGILDTEFMGKIVAETKVGNTPAIVPEVTGSAHVVAMGSLVLTDGDPFPTGFTLFSNVRCKEKTVGGDQNAS